MNVRELVDKLNLDVVAGESGLDADVKGGHVGDLLSEVMGNATLGCVWVTVQGHQNIIAVGVLREMAAIIIAGGSKPAPETIDKANNEGLPLLSFGGSSFELTGKIYGQGIE